MSNDNELGIVPVDQMVGGDGDTPGIAQPITTDEIQDVMMSEAPVEERIARLQGMKRDLEMRASGDTGDEFTPLITEIDGAIGTLEGPAETFASRGSLGLDTQARGDSQPTDETR